MAKRYRKKPVVVEAMQWRGSVVDAQAIIDWVQRSGGEGRIRHYTDNREGDCLLIVTLEGTMKALPNDWIIRGVEGEFYPCKPDIFDKTYEEQGP